MEAKNNSLKCPHCGARDFDLIREDIFLCRYCNEKFSFNLDEIKLDGKNKILIDELKQEFNKKIFSLDKENRNYRALLLHYSKKANSAKTNVAAYGCFSVFCLVLIAGFVNIITVIATIISAAGCAFVFIKKRKRYKKYQPIANYYASKAVDCEEEIRDYSRIISKLSE